MMYPASTQNGQGQQEQGKSEKLFHSRGAQGDRRT